MDRQQTSRYGTKAKCNQITRTFERGCGYLAAASRQNVPSSDGVYSTTTQKRKTTTMNKQMHRFTAPLESDDWKNRLREFLAQDDASLEAKYRENETESDHDPEPFYFVAPAPSEARFAVPTNVLSALDQLTR